MFPLKGGCEMISVTLYAFEMPPRPGVEPVLVEADEFFGKDEYDVVAAMAGRSTSRNGREYVFDVIQRLRDWHGIDLGDIQADDNLELARRFLAALEKHGLAKIRRYDE